MVKFKLTENALLVLGGSGLGQPELKAFDCMARGQRLPTTVTKAHLENIIWFLTQERGWVEKSDAPTKTPTKDTNGPTLEKSNTAAQSEENSSNGESTSETTQEKSVTPAVLNVTNDSKPGSTSDTTLERGLTPATPADKDSKEGFQRPPVRVCRYYKTGKCPHKGKSCTYSHPPVCKKFENFGYKERQGGCKERKCERLHLTLCNSFMFDGTCAYGEKCRFFHPKKLQFWKRNTAAPTVTIPSATEESTRGYTQERSQPSLSYATAVRMQPAQVQVQSEPKSDGGAFLDQGSVFSVLEAIQQQIAQMQSQMKDLGMQVNNNNNQTAVWAPITRKV